MVGVLDQGHLGDQVGELHQLGRGVASRDDHVHHLGTVAQGLQRLLHRHPAVVQGVGELIEDHDVVLALGDDLLAVIPMGAGQLGGVFQVLGPPGEPVAHGPDLDVHLLGGALFAEVGRRVLDELEHDDFHVAAPGTEHHSHCGGGLALAGAGVDDDEALVDAGAGH